ncbi:MAG TPA: cyanophycinase [Phenylobacterium sp.]|jgi:cyanophycinase|uniref:cyanophycinase n=1 Tax=Phenylobacterium sp. TaxID=1871053 RepID=UPI002C2181DD|nr:cyanophycinase [Phenylobacterium sp.]HXA40381.1 cyanophycinase [Phenylobacterium sp.]
MRFNLRILGPAATALLLAASVAQAAPVVRGPEHGTLIIAGGGALGPEIVGRFITLAGGPSAEIVVIPTAGGAAKYGPDCDCLNIFRKLGATHLTVLHTTDRKEADSEAFVAPLKRAKAVWFVGGRQWHLVDSYLGTRTEAEIKNLLARGGVAGGTSAGASIQASYMVRGAKSGNDVMIAPGYEQGFGLITGAAVDQHVTARHREGDLDLVVAKHPDVLGIGIDQSTAIEVKRDDFKVLGVGHVFIHDGTEQPNGGHYYLLGAGDGFDLRTLTGTAKR